MILAKLGRLFLSFHDRLKHMEETMAVIAEKSSMVAAKLGDPEGFITFAGQIKTKPEEIAEAFRTSARMNLDVLTLDVKFNHAIFMRASPESEAQIKKLLEPAKLEILRDLLEQHKRLNTLIEQSEAVAVRTAEIVAQSNRAISVRVQDMAEEAVRHVLKRDLSELYVKVQRKEDRIEKQLIALDKALTECLAFKATVENTIKVNLPSDAPFSVRRNSGS